MNRGKPPKIWAEFKGAPRGGDMSSALDCIHTQSHERYSEALAAIHELRKKVDEVFSAIRFVERRKGEAIYEILPAKGTAALSHELRFGWDSMACGA